MSTSARWWSGQALAGAAALFGVAESVGRALLADAGAQFGVVLCLLALCATTPPAFLRPMAAAIAVTAASVVSLALFHVLTVAAAVVQVIVLYRLGRTVTHREPLTIGLAAPFPILALFGPGGGEAAVLTIVLASLAPAATFAGIAHRARTEASVHHAARDAVAQTLLEHTARGERARIARELHDVVAHHISMTAVQAETARLATPGMPAAGERRLAEIGDTARAGLTEMRRLLGVLRTDAETDVMQHSPRHPQPGLDQLVELLDDARQAGGSGVRLIMCGAPAVLDPGVELAAYRIVQEALTNARRHAPGAAVDVELHYTQDALCVRIRDNGPGAPTGSRSAGHGLPGMRERAAAVGGRLRSGPMTVDGFLVEATLPAKLEATG